jgi:hypothetical protein
VTELTVVICFVHAAVLSIKTAFNLVKIHLLFRNDKRRDCDNDKGMIPLLSVTKNTHSLTSEQVIMDTVKLSLR